MTGTVICTDALRQIGVIRPGQTPNADALQDCYRQLNMLVKEWSIQRWTCKVTERKVLSLVNGQAEYVIGPSGTLVISPRPTTLDYCTVIQTFPNGTITEYPIIMATEQQWAQRVSQKNLAVSPASLVYVRYTIPNITIQVYPVPTASGSTVYSIGIYYAAQLVEFVGITDDVALQPGFEEALVKNLAKKIFPMFVLNNKLGHSMGSATLARNYEMIKLEADRALGHIKSINAENPEMACSAALDDGYGWYNIYGDTYAGGQ